MQPITRTAVWERGLPVSQLVLTFDGEVEHVWVMRTPPLAEPVTRRKLGAHTLVIESEVVRREGHVHRGEYPQRCSRKTPLSIHFQNRYYTMASVVYVLKLRSPHYDRR